MSSSATGVGMPICFLGAILLILTQKSSQKFGDVLGIMVLDLFFPKHCVHNDTARYVLSYSKPFELLTKNCLIIGNSSPKSLYLDNNQNDTREYKNK